MYGADTTKRGASGAEIGYADNWRKQALVCAHPGAGASQQYTTFSAAA